MKFKRGDIITGLPDNGCAITDEESLLLVTLSTPSNMKVKVIAHNLFDAYLGNSFEVHNRSTDFTYIGIEEFLDKYPNCKMLEPEELQEIFERYQEQKAKPKDVYVLSDEMRKELLTEMETLLEKYHYHPTKEGLNAILDEWAANNTPLIRLFEKHPNYNGKFQIVFDHDYHRGYDYNAIHQFRSWFYDDEVQDMFKKVVKIGAFTHRELYDITEKLRNIYYKFDYNVRTINGKTKEEYANEYGHFQKLKTVYENNPDVVIDRYDHEAYDREVSKLKRKIDDISAILGERSMVAQFVNNEAEANFAHNFPEAKVKQGQRLSRAINKILCSIGVDRAPNYNREFAKFSDAINPLQVKRHTVLSIHPVDYYTMSFGNSWSSCHTIDKENDRGIDSDHNYRGCNSSGTESYMLDGTSFIFYTVRSEYDGNELELQDKINRCMFHYHDNRLLQGRVYPQSNDDEDGGLYKDIREIVQKVMADILDVPNMWTNKGGTYACEDVVASYGTHYRDYGNFSNCNVSTLKDNRRHHAYIEIGHDPICPRCGREHDYTDNITCPSCLDELYKMEREQHGEPETDEFDWAEIEF